MNDAKQDALSSSTEKLEILLCKSLLCFTPLSVLPLSFFFILTSAKTSFSSGSLVFFMHLPDGRAFWQTVVVLLHRKCIYFILFHLHDDV